MPAAFAAAPVLTSPPTITGLPQQGQTLTAQNGTWENSPTAYQYQWRRCDASGGSCVNIRGNAQKTHNVVGADVGHRLRVRVTAVNADGATNAEVGSDSCGDIHRCAQEHRAADHLRYRAGRPDADRGHR